MTDSDREKRIEANQQTYSRWFTRWPSTHERAGQTVEVVSLERAQELKTALEHEVGRRLELEAERDDLLERDQRWRDDYLLLLAKTEEAVAAARDFAGTLQRIARQENSIAKTQARNVLARHPSFFPER